MRSSFSEISFICSINLRNFYELWVGHLSYINKSPPIIIFFTLQFKSLIDGHEQLGLSTLGAYVLVKVIVFSLSTFI